MFGWIKNKVQNANMRSIIISHRTEIMEESSELFGSTYKVLKENNVTRLEKEVI